MADEIDYESLWYEEIAEIWIRDFVLKNRNFKEVNVEITDPDEYSDDEDDDQEFQIKVSNIIFSIQHEGTTIRLWVFYDIENEELHECESLSDNQQFPPDVIAKIIYDIHQRWEAVKIVTYLSEDFEDDN